MQEIRGIRIRSMLVVLALASLPVALKATERESRETFVVTLSAAAASGLEAGEYRLECRRRTQGPETRCRLLGAGDEEVAAGSVRLVGCPPQTDLAALLESEETRIRLRKSGEDLRLSKADPSGGETARRCRAQGLLHLGSPGVADADNVGMSIRMDREPEEEEEGQGEVSSDSSSGSFAVDDGDGVPGGRGGGPDVGPPMFASGETGPGLSQTGGTAADVAMRHGSCGAGCATHVLADPSGSLEVPVTIGMTCPAGLEVVGLAYRLPGGPVVTLVQGSTGASTHSADVELEPFSAQNLESRCRAALGGHWTPPAPHNAPAAEVEVAVERNLTLAGRCSTWSEDETATATVAVTLTCQDQDF